MDERDRREAKRRAGERAAEAVEDGETVGLGTGSTTAFAIEALGRRVQQGLSIRGVPTSFGARQAAVEAGIDLAGIDEVAAGGDRPDESGDRTADDRADREDGGGGIDVAIDGADQVAGAHLLKGGGAAHAREKVVDLFADRLLVVVDPTKVTDALDDPVPVEVLPDARVPVARRVRERGGEPTLRTGTGKDGPVVTDNGNLVLDCDLGTVEDPAATAAWLSALPGVVEHGLFVDAADAVVLGRPDGVDVREP